MLKPRRLKRPDTLQKIPALFSASAEITYYFVNPFLLIASGFHLIIYTALTAISLQLERHLPQPG